MSNLELPVSPGAASPTRSSKRHQIKRSLSELASPTRSTRGQHKGNEINQDDKRLHPFHSNTSGRHSLDVPGLDGSTSIRSPVESRRASVLILAPENDARTRSREVQDRELHQVQAQMTESFDNLTQSLVELNTFSSNASRQLDESYYAVLEKMSTLQSTVVALKDLAKTSRKIYDGFDKESRSLENDVATQLGALGHFQNQQTQITTLQKRINHGRGKMQSLGTRLEAVRLRVDKWERADKQWQEKTRKKLKIVWSVMSAITLVLIILVWGIGNAHSSNDATIDTTSSTTERPLSILEPLNRSNYAQPPGKEDVAPDTGLVWKKPKPHDAALRALDEL